MGTKQDEIRQQNQKMNQNLEIFESINADAEVQTCRSEDTD